MTLRVILVGTGGVGQGRSARRRRRARDPHARDDLGPDWPRPHSGSYTYSIEITGEPSYSMDFQLSSRNGDHAYAGMVATASRVVNNIAAVVAAPPGIVTSHAQAGHTLHRMTNHVVDVDGDQASARTYVDAWITSVDNVSGINAIGFYDDELVRTDHGWRIARRTFTQVR